MSKKSKRKSPQAMRRRLKRAPNTSPTPAKRPRIFLETSGVIYHRHGHPRMQAAVQEAIGNGLLEVSNFIRMEYLRGVVLNLIELYFLIKESDSTSDALIDWSQKVHQERKLKIVLMTMHQWLVGQEDWKNKEKSQRRLGDLIIRLVYEFDETFTGRAKDRLLCRLGRIRFPRRAFHEDMLLRFYERFKAIQRGVPDCWLCTFKTKQLRELDRCEIDLYSAAQRQRFSSNKGYVTQAERVEGAVSTKETSPKCRWCERLGDTIIILQAPKKAVLVTADRAFEAFGQILNREIHLLPSLAELKRQVEGQKHAGEASPNDFR
jgi:hypothetical protein